MQSCDVDAKYNFPLQSDWEKQYFTSVSVTVLVYKGIANGKQRLNISRLQVVRWGMFTTQS